MDESGSNGYFHHSLGVVLYQLERYDDAVREFRRALSKEPSMATARYHLGASYMKLGDAAKAMDEYEAALAIDPNHEFAQAKVDLLTNQAMSPN